MFSVAVPPTVLQLATDVAPAVDAVVGAGQTNQRSCSTRCPVQAVPRSQSADFRCATHLFRYERVMSELPSKIVAV